MQRKSTTVGGLRLRWHERDGSGIPVVFVHGIPTGPSLWRHVVPRIERARCLAFEMVGYAASIPEGRERDISVSAQADYLLAWASAIDLERAVLVGHDLGGGVAQIAAIRRPGFCVGLLLTNAIGYDSWPIPSVKMLCACGPAVAVLPDLVVRQIVATMMLRGHDVAARRRESLQTHWAHYARHGGGKALIRQIDALDVRDTLAVAEALPRLGVPARLVWGAADPFQPIAYGERFARDLKAPLRRIEGGRHFTPEDHADIVAEEVSLLLQDIQRAG